MAKCKNCSHRQVCGLLSYRLKNVQECEFYVSEPEHDEYRWHDLRENPNDLPTERDNYLCKVMDVLDFIPQNDAHGVLWYDENGELVSRVIAWRDNETMEEEE